MTNKICLIKKEGALVPVYPSDVEAVKKMRSNVIKSAVITQPRNPDFHKKVFAICKETLKNVPAGHVWEGKTPYLLLKAIMFELGFVDTFLTVSGEMRLEVQSIAFEKMDNIEFELIYKKVVSVCAGILGCTYEELNKRGKEVDL